jgi:hypothetical protein
VSAGVANLFQFPCIDDAIDSSRKEKILRMKKDFKRKLSRESSRN